MNAADELLYHKNFGAAMQTHVQQQAYQIADLEARVKSLEDALRFYADSLNYPLPVGDLRHFDALHDRGMKASAALAGKETA